MFNYFEWIKKVGMAFWFLNTLLFVTIRNTLIPLPNPKYLPLQTNMVQMVQKTDYLRKQFKIRKISQNLYNLQQIHENDNILWNQYLQPSFFQIMLQNLNIKLNLHDLFNNPNFKVREVELILKIPNTWQRGGGMASSQPIPSRVESIIQTNNTGSIQSIMRAAGGRTTLLPRSIRIIKTQVCKRYTILPAQLMDDAYPDPAIIQNYIRQINQNIDNNGLFGEYQAYKILVESGFEVIPLDPNPPEKYGIIRNSYLNLQTCPDFGVERVVVDCYTPQYNVNKSLKDNCERIRQKINLKVNRKKQSDRILLNALNIPTHQLERIESIMNQWIYANEPNYIPNLKELIIVKQLPDRLNYIE